MKQDAFTGDAIKVRGLYPFATIGACMTERPIICDGEEDVGLLACYRHCTDGYKKKGRDECQFGSHGAWVSIVSSKRLAISIRQPFWVGFLVPQRIARYE